MLELAQRDPKHKTHSGRQQKGKAEVQNTTCKQRKGGRAKSWQQKGNWRIQEH